MAFLGSIGAANNILKVGKTASRLNWWMFDLDNYQLISMTTVPDNVADGKQIVYVSVSVPGLDYKPMLFSSLDNKKISFTLKVIARNNIIGNQLYIKQFDALRHPKVGLLSIFSEKETFVPNPQVLYHYGTGTTVPLVYYVTKVDMSHSVYNNWGYPQVSMIDMELTLNEEHQINKAEAVARKIGMVLGTLQSAGSMVANLAGVRRKPY